MVATIASIELESVNYHKESETYRAQYDQETTSTSMAVVALLSDVMDVDPTELEPLHAFVDTEALDSLLRVRDTMDRDISVTFTVEEHAITVYSYGVVTIALPGHDRTDDPNGVAPLK